MSRPHRPPRPVSFSVLLCRDCCCGAERKHPDFDHAKQESDLRSAVDAAGGRLHRVNCLDACIRSNVVVLRTHDQGKIWLGDLVDDESNEALLSFIRAGTRGEMPLDLGKLRFTPTSSAEEAESRCHLRGIPVRES